MKKTIHENELKKAVSQLQLNEHSKIRIQKNCELQIENRRKYFRIRGWQAAALSCLLLILFCSPAAAEVRETLQSWLSKMTKQEVQKFYDTAQQGRAESASTSRALTWDEKLRKDQLKVLYKNGEQFPTAEIIILEPDQDPVHGHVCYDATAEVWYYPSQRLTDEDLLEIIDYEYKVDYSLKTVGEANGNLEPVQDTIPIISESQALETAKGIIKAAYGIEPDTSRIFIETYSTGDYAVKYTGLEMEGVHIENCNILISGMTGAVDNLMYRNMDVTDKSHPAGESADPGRWYDKGLKLLSELANEEKPGIRYSACLIYYGENARSRASKQIIYLFELENNTTYTMGYLYDYGILQSLTTGDSYLDHAEEYHSRWKQASERNSTEYKLVEINPNTP